MLSSPDRDEANRPRQEVASTTGICHDGDAEMIVPGIYNLAVQQTTASQPTHIISAMIVRESEAVLFEGQLR